jgi:23S rRNA (adenine2503-C2)-methyltransferase
VLTKLRDSAGQDVDGGCGQLRARALDGAARERRQVVQLVRPATRQAG